MDSDVVKLNGPAAENIINSLRSGIPNINSIMHINVDITARKQWLDDIKRDLDSYIKNGYSKVRFINGRYGNGKTHLMNLIKHYAKDLNYVVSSISAESVRLNRYDELYSAIIKNLEIKDRTQNVFKYLIENFVITKKHDLEEKHGTDDQDRIVKDTKTLIKHFTDGLNKSSYNFKNALLKYMNNFIEASPNDDWQVNNETIMRWFHGEKLPSKDIRCYNIYALNDKDNSRDSIKSLCDIVVNLGFNGLLILIDEAERILSQSINVAKNANNNIRHILDSVDGGAEANPSEYCYILIASTPEMMSDKEKGFRSYTALWDRISNGLSGDQFSEYINPKAIIVDLEHAKAQVKIEDLDKILRKIIQIHGKAFTWDAEKIFNERIVSTISKKAYDSIKQNSPLRTAVRRIIEILDLTFNDNSFINTFDASSYNFKPDAPKYSKWDE